MDELRIRLNTQFTRTLITRILSKLIQKNFGSKVDILLKELDIQVVDDKVRRHINIDAEMDKDELMGIIKSADLI